MKKITLLMITVLGITSSTWAQDSPAGKPVPKNYFKFQARVKAGIGQTFTALPMVFKDLSINGTYDTTNEYKSKTSTGFKNKILKTKWGPYIGGNFDFYFHPNFGFGLDIDYFSNKLKFVEPQPIKDYLNDNSYIKLVESNRKNQSLIFVGIGPSFKVFTNEKWDVDVNIRGGLSHLIMGSLSVSVDSLMITTNMPRKTILIYDYSKALNVFGAKAGIYANYWFNSFIGVTLGVDFIHSFVSASKINGDADYKFQYKDPEFFLNSDGKLNGYQYFGTKLDDYQVKKLNVNHFSVSAGLVFRVIPAPAKAKTKDIIVLVKDSLTSIPVSGVDVSLRDKKGTVLTTLKTGSNGKVVFEKIAPENYSVSGVKGELYTNKAIIAAEEFNKHGTSIYKELLLNDPKFILAGVTVECDKKDQALGNVKVELTNKSNGKTISVLSDADGKFSFNLEPNTDFAIVGSREGYYSGVQNITTKGLDRSKTLYVQLILCVDQLEVGKTFILKNIYYDFDKCDIRKDAAVELDHLVEIMKKYPGMEIELSSHTDQRGTDAYNNRLSQCRAESAVNYIISKGIDKSRITAVGFGKTKLIQDCTKVQGCPTTSQGDCPCHQNNRRTEVKILKM